MEGIMQQAVHINQTTIDTIREMCCLVFWTPGLPFAANNTYLFRTLQAFFNKNPHFLGPAKKCLEEVGSTTFEEFRKVAHSAFNDLRSQIKSYYAIFPVQCPHKIK
ncbi:hypothetical protein BT69DRAFT_1333250 [Atractiella rhizophila]|nr:hypothetical protein BT69DRAFT_1333250 [Atractiella rhizophila]